MGSTDYRDLDEIPGKVDGVIKLLASSAAHLADLLKEHPYPGV